jgi:hypothetical protein
MTSLATAIAQTSNLCLKDDTQPPKLVIESARYGDFTIRPPNRAPVRVDPFELRLAGVEAGCKLQVLNLSDNPAATWAKDATELPSNTLRAGPDGRYCAIYSNAEAKKAGIMPGDVIEIRQVDEAGNASEPTRVAMNQRVGPSQVRVSANDQYGVQLNNGTHYEFRPYPDARGPKALPERMKIEGTKEGEGMLTGDRALEPYGKVVVTNRRTLKAFEAPVDEAGKLALTFEAQVGDLLAITAYDTNGNSTSLGEARYAPACVKGGPAAQVALQKAC